MIAMARSDKVKNFMQSSRATSFLREKYVAGEHCADGIQRAVSLLDQKGIRSSLFYMGEYVNSLDLVEQAVDQKIKIANSLKNRGLDIHVSIDPTQIGHHIDPSLMK
ncbi:MAG: hypothetical protein ACK5NS_19945, partial [Denitromonas sp.]